MSDDYHIKLQAMQELREALELKKVNQELLEYFSDSLRWIMHYCNKNDIPLPEADRIMNAVVKAMEIADKLDTHRKSTTENNNGRFNITDLLVKR